MPQQQMVRFAARSKSLLDTFVEGQKAPEDSAFFQLAGIGDLSQLASQIMPPPGSLPGGPSSAPSKAGETAAKSVLEDEASNSDDEEEANMLGIVADPSKKRKNSDKPGRAVKRRTKQELFAEETEKIENELVLLLVQVADWPGKPAGYDVGALDRKIGAKLKQAQKETQFDQVEKLEGFQKQVKTLKDCSKTATSYLPSKGLPNRKHAESFMKAFNAGMSVAPNVVAAFPAVVQQHYMELCHENDIKSESWGAIAANLSAERLSKVYADDHEKVAATMFEKVLSHILEKERGREDLEEVVDIILKVCSTILEKRPSDGLAGQLNMIVQFVKLDTQGAANLDGIIKAINDQAQEPIIRVLLRTTRGKKLLELAEARNGEMLQLATRVTSLLNMKDPVQ